MIVNRVNTTSSPNFGIRIPTAEVIGFISKASNTANKFESSAKTATALSGGKIQGVHMPVMDMWAKCIEMSEKIRQNYPELKVAAESVDKYSSKLLKKVPSKEYYFYKLNKKIKSFDKKFGEFLDIKDFE